MDLDGWPNFLVSNLVPGSMTATSMLVNQPVILIPPQLHLSAHSHLKSYKLVPVARPPSNPANRALIPSPPVIIHVARSSKVVVMSVLKLVTWESVDLAELK